jgi:glycine C-acetyltransferase
MARTVAPGVVAGSLKALDLVASSSEARERLSTNTRLFRELMVEAGFDVRAGEHPITPVMFRGDEGARLATRIADHMLGDGVYVIAFSFPVVPKGQPRIRVQLSAAHSEDEVRLCVDAFVKALAACA